MSHALHVVTVCRMSSAFRVKSAPHKDCSWTKPQQHIHMTTENWYVRTQHDTAYAFIQGMSPSTSSMPRTCLHYECCKQSIRSVTSVSVSLILPQTAPDSSLQPAMILSSSRLKTRSMPTLTPTAGTSLLLNIPTSLSYLHISRPLLLRNPYRETLDSCSGMCLILQRMLGYSSVTFA